MCSNAVVCFIIAVVLSAVAAYPEKYAVAYTPVLSGYALFEGGNIVKGYSAQANEIGQVWLEAGYMSAYVPRPMSADISV